MGLFDFWKKEDIKSNMKETMNKQKVKVSRKTSTKKKGVKKINKPDIQIIYSDQSRIEEFEDIIGEYYTGGYKLAGSVSMHGSLLCATLIKE